MKALSALNPYIWRYKWLLILGTIFIIISNVFSVYPAQIVRMAIDLVAELVRTYRLVGDFEAVSGLDALLLPALMLFGGLVVLMAILRGIFLFLTRQTLIVMSRKVEYDLHKDLYNHFQDLTLSFYRRSRTGDLMARITEDVGRVRMYLGPGIMYTLNAISTAIVVIITMIAVNPELTLYVLLPLPILSFVIYYVESIIQRKSDLIQRQLSKLTTFTQEIFSGIRVVKAYVKEEESSQVFAQEADTYKDRSVNLAKIEALFIPSIIFLAGLSTLIVVWVGGGKVINGSLTIGNIAEFIIYIGLLTWPIIAVGWVTTLIQRAAASQVRLNELLAERPEIRFPETGPELKEASIRFEDVHFTYADTGIHAIKEVSFELKAGQKLGILGPTGSGKSTLCALIPRLFDINTGKIQISGHDIAAFSMEGLRSELGYAPQDVFLFSASVAENIAFGEPEASLDEIQAAAKSADIYDNIQGFSEGFETVVGERGVTLSGGQKQRISVARAWIRKPKLLILDDVLSAVDTRTEENILQNLRTYRSKQPDSSVVMVAHRISCLQDSDLIIVLEEGRITQQGTHQSLIEEEGYYKRIYEKQLLEANQVVD